LLEIRSGIQPADTFPAVLAFASVAFSFGLLFALGRALMGYSTILFMTLGRSVPPGHKINRGAPWLVGQSAALLVWAGYSATAYHFSPWLGAGVLITAAALYRTIKRHARGLAG
jgi:apolipoprotein N-acyltransferase